MDEIILNRSRTDHLSSSPKLYSSKDTVTTDEISESSFSFLGESSDLSGCNLQNSTTQPLHGGLFEINDDFSRMPVRPRRVIRFSDEIQYHSVVHRRDYSKEERSACWYARSEFSDARKEAQAMIALLEKGIQLPPGTDFPTLRGLENFTKQGQKTANQIHRLAIEAVLTEQLEQDLAGSYDDKAIAAKYRQISLPCRFPARMKALQDHEEAGKKLRVAARSSFPSVPCSKKKPSHDRIGV